MAIIPVYGEGFFHITWGLIYYTIVFDYIDQGGDYYEYVRDPHARRREERESQRLMQEAIDSERTIINGVKVRPIVDHVQIHFRGGRRRHSLTFHIRIPYDPLDGVNVYENYYEPSRAEYSYIVYWIAPPNGRIRMVDSPGKVVFRANNRIAVIRVRKGTRISGYEAVEFEIHKS
ncbi:MAG: hypothetical protein F7B19_00890 [Desulfurococcales archaeon]|nr:hypothetical protein [Desulfurococcales archaeon]MCE4627289.1 hypothetical protein [Desulfurococcales archaeon]